MWNFFEMNDEQGVPEKERFRIMWNTMKRLVFLFIWGLLMWGIGFFAGKTLARPVKIEKTLSKPCSEPFMPIPESVPDEYDRYEWTGRT